MKRLLLLLSCSGALMCAAELSGVHSVYLMPMSRGFDQYLANRMAGEHVFRVVTDPKLADAFFSDRLGQAFEVQLDAMLPPPPAPDKPKTEKESDETSPLVIGAASGIGNPMLNSSFGRGKGTIFLVDKTSRQVLWSIYQPPKNPSSREMDRTALDIVSRLKKDWKKVEVEPAPRKTAKAPAPVKPAPQAIAAAPVKPAPQATAAAPVKPAPQAAPAPAPAAAPKK